jgi:hypothetical protein
MVCVGSWLWVLILGYALFIGRGILIFLVLFRR